MGAFKDTYDIIKDLMKAARAVQNQEVVQLAMDLQEKFFELREDNDNLLKKIKELELKITSLEQIETTENDLEYDVDGTITIKGDSKKILYCGCCWKQEHKLIPLSHLGNGRIYQCGVCKSRIDTELFRNRRS